MYKFGDHGCTPLRQDYETTKSNQSASYVMFFNSGKDFSTATVSNQGTDVVNHRDIVDII